MPSDLPWIPPSTFEEKLRWALIPPKLIVWDYLRRELARGEKELGLVQFLSERARVAVDVGANRGVWSEIMRRHAAHVHAFEPNPKLFKELSRGARSGITPHLIALSDKSGTARLHVPKRRKSYSNHAASLSAEAIGNVPFGVVDVNAKRLDDLALGDIGFIKIDVEGHEAAVIAGAKQTLQRCRPNLIIEIEERHTRRPIADSIAEVCSHGYEAFALRKGALQRVSQLDLDHVHTNPRSPADYLCNWIFLPL